MRAPGIANRRNIDHQPRSGQRARVGMLVLTGASAFLLAACGGGDSSASNAEPSPSLTTITVNPSPAATTVAPTPSATTAAPNPNTPTPTLAPVTWTPPPGTVPGRCGGNGMDGRSSLNGWEVCWTEGSISQDFAINVARAVAANEFRDGSYQAQSPTAGVKTIDCRWFRASTGTSIMGCSGGTVTDYGQIELSWLG